MFPHISERVSTPQLKFGSHEVDPRLFRKGKKYGVPLRQKFWGASPPKLTKFGGPYLGTGFRYPHALVGVRYEDVPSKNSY